MYLTLKSIMRKEKGQHNWRRQTNDRDGGGQPAVTTPWVSFLNHPSTKEELNADKK